MGSQSSPEPQGVSMRFLLVVVLLLVLGLCSVEGMRKRKRNRNQQQGRRGKQEAAGGGGSGEGGECTEDELECLRQVIPGPTNKDLSSMKHASTVGGAFRAGAVSTLLPGS